MSGHFIAVNCLASGASHANARRLPSVLIKLYVGLTRFYAVKANVPWAASSALDVTE